MDRFKYIMLLIFTLMGCDSGDPPPVTTFSFSNNSDINISVLNVVLNPSSQNSSEFKISLGAEILPGGQIDFDIDPQYCGVPLFVYYGDSIVFNQPSETATIPCGSSNFSCEVKVFFNNIFMLNQYPTFCNLKS